MRLSEPESRGPEASPTCGIPKFSRKLLVDGRSSIAFSCHIIGTDD